MKIVVRFVQYGLYPLVYNQSKLQLFGINHSTIGDLQPLSSFTHISDTKPQKFLKTEEKLDFSFLTKVKKLLLLK